jgi:hypothetical protein
MCREGVLHLPSGARSENGCCLNVKFVCDRDCGCHLSTQWSRSKSCSASFQWNPRNLERPWYGVWNSTLNDLTKGSPQHGCYPQFPLWFTPEDIESDREDDAPDTGHERERPVDQEPNNDEDLDNDPLDLERDPNERPVSYEEDSCSDGVNCRQI